MSIDFKYPYDPTGPIYKAKKWPILAVGVLPISGIEFAEIFFTKTTTLVLATYAIKTLGSSRLTPKVLSSKWYYFCRYFEVLYVFVLDYSTCEPEPFFYHN